VRRTELPDLQPAEAVGDVRVESRRLVADRRVGIGLGREGLEQPGELAACGGGEPIAIGERGERFP